MNGYYDSNAKGRGQKVPTGRLRISVTNIPEFKDLIMKANREADQLRETIRQLESFYLGVDFDIGDPGDDGNDKKESLSSITDSKTALNRSHYPDGVSVKW